jgi:hypothetical protein
MKETVCTKQILSYLTKIGVFAWRNNTGVLRGMNGHWVRFGYPGSSDILGIMKDGTGRLLCVENKAAGAPTTPAQEAFKYTIELNKGIYIVAKSLDDLVRQLGEL